MRAKLLTAMAIPALLLAAAYAESDEPPAADDAAATASEAAATTEAATPAEAADAADTRTASTAKKDSKLALPPGFKPKKRGPYTLYCRKESVIGTRFPAEKCYDEQGIREMIQALRENQEKVDQMRRICGNMEACGGGG
jgi:hypothetical protein